MSLVLASVWAAREFDPACVPDKRTVRSWVLSGEVPGKVIGRQTYIDASAWEKKFESTGSSLADSILEKLK